MFDGSRVGDAAAVAVAAITAAARAEAVACARRLAAIAELTALRCAAADAEVRDWWACDTWDAAAAEVSAALGATHGVSSGQMRIGLALRERLPRVGALFAVGDISYWLVRTIVARTTNITDPEALALVDRALAADITSWGPLSLRKTEEAIDFWIDRHDPAAIRRTRAAARGRDVVIGSADDASGTTSIWGALTTPDAAALDRRLITLARTVCAGDPRTIAQRRADALGALAAGADTLACRCDDPGCPVADAAPRPSNIVVHVVAEAAALATPPDPATNGDFASRPITSTTAVAEALAPDPTLDAPRPAPAGAALVVGGGVIPTALLADLIAAGASVTPVHHPGPDSPGEPRYRPSTALDEYVRLRDVTCRFPHCDQPATACDVDHTLAYDDGGPTHPSNLKCLCRKHHLLKTMWGGPGGWRDIQHPDGRVVWTAPTGQTYTTHPGSRILFPALCLPTGQAPPPVVRPKAGPGDSKRDFTRRRTRADQRASRINAERALNDAHVTVVEEPPPF